MKESCPVIWTEEVDSTNNEALRHSDCTDGMSVWAASFQTAGRGQRGNVWISSRGENLTFSILVRFGSGALGTLRALRQFAVSQAVTLGITDYLSSRGIEASIKWPNDIYWKDSKMAGILIEHSNVGRSIANTIVGVGLDVNQTVFESDAPNPISMAMVAGHEFDMEPILQEIILRFAGLMGQCSPEEREAVNRMYHERMYRNSGFHRFADIAGEFKARIIRVEPNGCLVLETDAGGLRTYEVKQVRFLLSSSVD